MTQMNKDLNLSDIPKRNIYQVPEQYFERLPMRVMERTAAAEKQAPGWQHVLWRPSRLVIAPLVLLLVFVGVYVLSLPGSPQPTSAGITALAETEIVDYLTNNNTTLEISDLAELTSLSGQELTADFLNVSNKAAQEELEYRTLTEEDF